ncbi:MAG: glucosaminidase domain-containing protein, partial [Bacteroidales bacterium]|nr:glucosaminidase domain-containing protein [Bacteroidales bacterium]
MTKNNSLIYFFLLPFLLCHSLRLGAGSSMIPEGDKVKIVAHGVDLPPGFSIEPSNYSVTSISTDYGNKYVNPAKFELPTKIMTKGLLPKERMISFLWFNNNKIDIVDVETIADLYVKEAAKEGVNHDIAFAQMMLETGYLKFTGDVSKLQNNFCGLGATGDGVPGLSFKTVEEGVRAHIQHLKAYASTDSLNHKKVDDRYGRIKRGTATEIQHLTGRWATDPLYDQKLARLIALVYSGYV